MKGRFRDTRELKGRERGVESKIAAGSSPYVAKHAARSP